MKINSIFLIFLISVIAVTSLKLHNNKKQRGNPGIGGNFNRPMINNDSHYETHLRENETHADEQPSELKPAVPVKTIGNYQDGMM